MKPIGMLMWEHRLIERVIGLFPEELARINTTNRVNTAFIQTAVDFIRTYADMTHHGKEEDILFKELEQKPLTPDLARIMGELVNEHVYARSVVKKLVDANDRYILGEDTIPVISKQLELLAGFYPDHIKKEDRDFFHQSMEYLTPEEQDRMRSRFEDFDRMMIHEKYKSIVEKLSGSPVPWAPPGMVR
jgi:hemerythrin-like domain-containing protein